MAIGNLKRLFKPAVNAELQAQAKAPAKRALYSAQAVDELVVWITRMPDPDYTLQKAGINRADLRKLESDDEISTAIETRREAVIATPWRIEPSEGPIAEWLTEELMPHVGNLLRGAWDAVPYGYSVLERIYQKTPDGRIGLKTIETKPFEWFEPTRDGELKYYPPMGGFTATEGVVVDTALKFLLTRRAPTYRNPYGQALLSRAWWPWFFRTNGWQFWSRFLERFGSPLLLGKTAGDQEAMADALLEAVNTAVLAMHKDDDVQAVAPAQAGEAFERFSDQVDRRIQKLILGQTLTTDTGKSGGGSYALGNVHDQVRQDRRMADLRLVASAGQSVVDGLMFLNFPSAEPHDFILQDNRGLEIGRAERDAKLKDAGIVNFTEQYLMDRYDFEDGDIEVPSHEVPAALQPGGEDDQDGDSGDDDGDGDAKLTGKAGLALAASGARMGRFTKDQRMLEELAGETLSSSGQPIPASVIRKAIETSSNPEQLIEKLDALAEGYDPLSFRELTEQALFTADVMGYHNAEKKVGGG